MDNAQYCSAEGVFFEAIFQTVLSPHKVEESLKTGSKTGREINSDVASVDRRFYLLFVLRQSVFY